MGFLISAFLVPALEIPGSGSAFQQGLLVLPHLGLRCNGRLRGVPIGRQVLTTRQDNFYFRDYFRFIRCIVISHKIHEIMRYTDQK